MLHGLSSVNFAQSIKSTCVSLAFGAISVSLAILLPLKVAAAERITLNVPPFGEFYVRVADLEAFVETGAVSPELAYYLSRFPPHQVAKLPELLSTSLEANPLSISNFANSTIGAAVIENFGKGIRSDADLNGFYALRSAVIAAAFDESGLTVLNLLHQFPQDDVYIDLPVLNKYVQQGTVLLNQQKAIAREFFPTAETAVDNSSTKAASSALAASQWQKSTFTYRNPRRSQAGSFNLYQPQVAQPVPLVVISHGLASDRQTFAYLAQHLAAEGIAAVVIEHDAISLNRFSNFLSGATRFPKPNNLINQPLDIKYVLDRLEQEAQGNPELQQGLNLEQIGLIGQSFGGYTALAVAGGQLILDPAAKECQPENYEDVLLDLSSLAKCTYNKLNNPQKSLRDPRIDAVIAINPLGKIFGKAGLSSVEIPTMIVAGTQDLITPPVAEQMQPFTWLNQDLDRYLVLVSRRNSL